MQLEEFTLADVNPEEWDGFLDRAGNHSPFCRHAWLELIGRADPAREVRIIALCRDRRLIAALPVLDQTSTLFPQSHSLPQGSPAGPVVAAGEDEAEMARILLDRWVASRTRGWGCRLAVTFDREDPPCAELLRNYAFTLFNQEAWRMRTGEGNFAEWETSLAGDVRKRLRQAQERGAAFEELHSGAQAEDIVRLARLTASRHRRRLPYGESFYSLLLGGVRPAAVRSGLVRLFVVTVDSRPVAFNLCLVQAGVCWLIDHGADRSFSAARPVDLLYRGIVETAFNEGLSAVDLGAVPPGAESLARFKASLGAVACRRLSAVKQNAVFAAGAWLRRWLP
ncbi:MAG TPA: GNAT family N-acetyltransferase [Candidatus Glassbacteria bacterium]|nr:GNAT family N-acetyltransferase [Candidatus Glassbacteria bacterium]